MTIASNSITPKGISLSRNNEGATVISHYTAGMLGLKIFAFVWSSIWLGATSFIMLKLWRDEGGFSNLLPALMGMAIVPFFFLIGVVAAAYFIWLLYKRTEISLIHSTLQITRRLGPFAKSRRYEKSRIKLFKVLQDGGQRKDSFPSFAVEMQLEGSTATLFSRQTPDVADWLCITLNEWLDKTKSNIFAGHDAPENASPLPSTTAIIEARQKHLAHVGKWSWPTVAVMLVAVPLFLFRDPIATYLSKKIPLFPPIGEYPVQLRTSDSKYKIDHALRSAPILLDTTDDVTWKLTTKAAGQVAIENGKLVLKLDTFTIYDCFPCNPSSPCVKVIDVHFALATESGQSFGTIAESAPISINTVLPASGYKVGYSVVTLENNIDITAAQLATAWPIITVRSKTGDSGEPGSSHHAPPHDAWRTALIAGSTKGEAYWQQGCDAAKSLWAKIQMRCNAQLAQALESKTTSRQAETGMGNGDTPLMLAIDADNLEALAVLLKRDVNVNEQSANGHAALNRAAERGYTEMVRRLIAAGANVEGTANPPARYETPLAAAASFRRWESVIALLQAGANPNARDSHSRAPVDYATYSPMGQPIDRDPTEPARRIAALKLLLDKGARADDDVPLRD